MIAGGVTASAPTSAAANCKRVSLRVVAVIIMDFSHWAVRTLLGEMMLIQGVGP